MTGSTVQPELQRWRWLFVVAAVYDIALGVAFLVLWQPVFDWLGMTPPPLVAYITLPAIFVFVQGVGYAIVAGDPLDNLGIVKVGILYKALYAALAGFYFFTDQIPAMFFAWFGLFDFLFFIAFVLFLRWAMRQPTAS